MSQFTEAVLHNKIRPSSIHESVVQDSHICQSDILQLYGQIPDLCRTCSSDFPGGMPLDNRNSLSHSAYQAKVDQGEPFGDPGANSGMSGMTPDLLGHRMAFNDPPYSGLPPDAFSSSWKSAVSNASGHSQFSPFNQASSRPVGLQSAPFGNRINTNCGFYGANSTPSVNNSSTETATEGIFPEEGTGPAWCATAWSENLVTGSDVHAWDKPLTSLRCREGGPESIIPGSDSERAWRYRTSSDSGRVSPHKRNSGATRSRQGSQRRRGRTLSGGSSTSADGFNGINLPSGQAFDAGDFDMPAKEPTPATSVLSTSAQPHDLGHSDSSPMSDPTYQPLGTSSKKLREASYLTPPHDSSLSMQDTDLSQSKLGVLGQPSSPVDEKLLPNSSRLWSSSAPIDSHAAGDGHGISSGDRFVYSEEPFFNQFRPLTSDQCTQHDVLLGTRGLGHAQAFGRKQVDFAYGMEFPTDEKTDFHSDEHLWLYEDPQGRVQGEFGDAQMQSWLLAGRYFTTSLRIRRKCDDTFSTLADYIKLFGRTPFVPGPRIPPLRGAITQEMIIQVRALLAIQQRAVLTAVNGPLDIRHQIPSTIPLSTGFNSTTSAVVDSSDGDKYPKINVPGSVGSNMQMDLKNGLTSLCGMSLSGWDADSSQRQQELPQLMMLKRLMQNLNPGGGGSGGGAPLNSLAILNTISDILAKTKPESRDAVLSGTTRPLNFNPAFSAPVQFADVCNGLQQSQALALAQLLSAASLNAPGCFGWPQGTHPADLAASVNQSPTSVGGLPTLTPAVGIPNDGFQPSAAPSVGVDPTKTASDVSAGVQSFDPVDTPTSATVVKAGGAANKNGKSSKKALRKQLRQNGAPAASELLDPNADDKPSSSQSSSTATRSVSQSGSTSSQSSLWASSAEFPMDGIATAATSGCSSSRQPLAVSANKQSQVCTKTTSSAKTGTLATNFLTGKSGAKTLGQPQGRPFKQQQTASHPETMKAKKQPSSPTKSPNALGSGLRKKGKKQQLEANEPVPGRANPRKVSKKSGGCTTQGSGDNANSEELTALIQWVQSMLAGIELREKVDIPTFVELLTTIDAPYEVESMLLAYIGNSSRSMQFVKEFLDRRHSCWQLHRKQLETAEAKGSAKKNSSHSSGTSRTEDGNMKDSFNKTYADSGEPQTESPWQQIKPKGGSNRKAKKAKQLS